VVGLGPRRGEQVGIKQRSYIGSCFGHVLALKKKINPATAGSGGRVAPDRKKKPEEIKRLFPFKL